MRDSVAVLALVCLAAHVAAAQPDSTRRVPARGTIDGVVSDTALVPLADAIVSIVGSSIKVLTTNNGRFRLVRMPPGQYMLLVRRIGFEPASATVQVAADTVRLSFPLERVVASLDTVRVATKRLSPRLAEFEARRKAGEGQFVTQAEIEKRNSPWVSGLFGGIHSVSVISTGRSSIATNQRYKNCRLSVVLDGMPVDSDLDMLPATKELAGVEVYLGPATIPLQYKRWGMTCGLVLVWTRDGTP